MSRNRKHKKRKGLLWKTAVLLAAIIIAVGSIGYTYYRRMYHTVLGEVVERGADIDLRDRTVTEQEYLQVTEENPDVEVYWNIPIGDAVYEADAKELVVPTGEDFADFREKLHYFEQLETIDLRQSGYEPSQIAEIISEYPNLQIEYVVVIDGQEYSPDTEELILNNSSDTTAFAEAAAVLPNVKSIVFEETVQDPEKAAAVYAAYPEASLECVFELYGKEVSWDAEELDLTGIAITDTSALEAAIPMMPNLTLVDMTDCGIADEDMEALNQKFESVSIVWTIYFKGIYPFRTDTDNFCISKFNATSYPGMTDEVLAPLKYFHNMVTLDLGHMELTNVSFCAYMPHLRYLIIGDNPITDISGLSNCYEIYYIEAFLTSITDVSPLMDKTSLKHLNLCFASFSDYTQLLSMTFLDRLWIKNTNLTSSQISEINTALKDTWVVSTGEHSSVDYLWRHDDSYFEMRDNLGMEYMIAK